MTDDEMKQQIVIFGDGSHEDVVYACLQACLENYVVFGQDEAYQEWLRGRFTKTVRVAKTQSVFDTLGTRIDGTFSSYNNVKAIAFLPAVFDRESYLAKKTQVSGLDRERLGWHKDIIGRWSHAIAINPDVEMSTGKTAAQVCHAALAMMMRKPEFFEQPWVITENKDDFATVQKYPFTIKITDAGLTEIEPGTLTVVAGIYEQ